MKKKNKIPTLNQDFELETFLTVLKKNVLIVILFLAIAICGGYVYYRYTQPKYSSSSVIQIKKENKTREILGLGEDVKMAPTIEIMRSDEFLKTVIKNLPLNVSYFTEGAFLNNETYGSKPFCVEFEIRENSIYDTPIYYELNSDNNSYDIHIGEDGKEHNIPFDKMTELPEGINLKLSAPNKDAYNENTGIKDKYYFTINSERHILREISQGLDISTLSDEAGTIQITYDCYNARKSADIVNAIAEQFLEFDVMKNRESSMATIAYIDEQMDNMVDELSQIENQLQTFRITNGITNEELKAHKNDLLEAKVSRIEQRVFDIDYEIETLKEVSNEIKTNPNINIYELMALMSGQESNAFIESMLKSLQDLVSKRELLLFDVTESNHKIVVIDKQIESKKETISDFINSTVVRLEKEKSECINKAKEVQSDIHDRANYDEIEYSKLQRMYNINESYYDILLGKKTDILISQSGYVSTNLVLEKANTPIVPISPILSKSITMATILALVLSILFLLARYLFYNKILTSSDIEKYTEIPIIGEVITSRQKSVNSQPVVHKNARSHVTENFRKIRTNLDFYPIEAESRILLTTSTVPGEGKTFVAINTADIYAMSGKKVLLVDFDLRKPRLDQCLSLDNEYGMSTILTNHKTWQECIHKNVIENLDIITSGPVTPIAAELLMSKYIYVFVEEIRKEYDIIIFDTPPLGIIHDAITLSKYADNIFYVMRHGISVKGYIEYLNSIKEEHNLKNISIVLNGIPASKHSSYGYSKYGYSNYGKYGYSYNTDDTEEEEEKGFLNKLLFWKK